MAGRDPEDEVKTYLTRLADTINRYEHLTTRASAVKDTPSRHGEALQIDSQKSDFKDAYKLARDGCQRALEAMPHSMRARRGQLENRLAREKARYRKVRDEYNAIGISSLVEASNRDELLDGAAENPGLSMDPLASGENTTRTLDAALGIHQDISQMNREMIGVAQETQQRLGGVIEELDRQRERMEEALRVTADIDGELTRANKLLTEFIKRLSTDRFIIAFATLIILAIVGIIVYSAVKPDQSTFNTPGELQPPDPNEVVNTRRLTRGPLPGDMDW